jgi:hypothetical protein
MKPLKQSLEDRVRCRSPSAPPGLWRAPARRAAGHLTVAVADVTATKDARSIPRGDPSPTGRPQSHLSPRPFQDPIVTFGSVGGGAGGGGHCHEGKGKSIEGMWRVATGRPTCRAGFVRHAAMTTASALAVLLSYRDTHGRRSRRKKVTDMAPDHDAGWMIRPTELQYYSTKHGDGHCTYPYSQ